MRACMRAWTEAETDSDIFRHDARNLQLRRRLAERGIDFRGAARSHVTSGRPASGKPLGWNKGLSRKDSSRWRFPLFGRGIILSGTFELRSNESSPEPRATNLPMRWSGLQPRCHVFTMVGAPVSDQR